jgi:hypothetical protein
MCVGFILVWESIVSAFIKGSIVVEVTGTIWERCWMSAKTAGPQPEGLSGVVRADWGRKLMKVGRHLGIMLRSGGWIKVT